MPDRAAVGAEDRRGGITEEPGGVVLLLVDRGHLQQRGHRVGGGHLCAGDPAPNEPLSAGHRLGAVADRHGMRPVDHRVGEVPRRPE